MNNKSAAVVVFCIALVAIGWVMVVAVTVASVITIVKKGIELAQGQRAPVVSAEEWAIAFEELPVEPELPPVAPTRKRKKKQEAVAA